MTILVSLYAAEGIVFAADRQIVTRTPGAPTERQQPRKKVFKVKKLGIGAGGVVGYFGLAQVRGQPMADWLVDVISGWRGSRRVRDFDEYLRDALTAAVTRQELVEPSGFHIGAFEERAGIVVPVFDFVTNIGKLDPATGVYGEIAKYSSGEHFPEHPDHPIKDVPLPQLRDVLMDIQRKDGVPFWFRNGDLPFFSKPWNALEAAVHEIVRLPEFRAPTDLRAWNEFALTLVRTTASLNRTHYRGGAPRIGGRADAISIPWP